MSATAAQLDLMAAAAHILYSRANAATEGPWQHMCMGSEGCQVLRVHTTIRDHRRSHVARFGRKDWHDDHHDADFVATMSPPVAVALAQWLQVKAANPSDHDYGYALAIAERIVNPEGEHR